MHRELNRLLVVILLLVAVKVNARTVSATSFLRERSAKYAVASSSAKSFAIDSAATAFLQAGGHLQLTDFPIGDNESGTLDLKPAHSPIDATTEVWQGTSHGDVRIGAPSFVAYRG